MDQASLQIHAVIYVSFMRLRCFYRTYALLFIDFLWQQMIFIENKVINEVFDDWSK